MYALFSAHALNLFQMLIQLFLVVRLCCFGIKGDPVSRFQVFKNGGFAEIQMNLCRVQNLKQGDLVPFGTQISQMCV